ncbi:hypothetical protein DXK93_31165 [Achromobacter sp. K91]|uniref:hypothetical protein n=1 Tax=Achromobacter sp. K91 TaxID=2292262 RepID=UPI000E670619|nr:hypothetical protein [Achromobacter sp. K91]RII99271.1 hypothetical protein DXK93_31165 [Achromobacter sp. K91]
MPKLPFHADSDNARRDGQPVADGPPTSKQNRDPNTNSGYPAGGKELPKGKDAFGRSAKVREQAEKRRG